MLTLAPLTLHDDDSLVHSASKYSRLACQLFAVPPPSCFCLNRPAGLELIAGALRRPCRRMRFPTGPAPLRSNTLFILPPPASSCSVGCFRLAPILPSLLPLSQCPQTNLSHSHLNPYRTEPLIRISSDNCEERLVHRVNQTTLAGRFDP